MLSLLREELNVRRATMRDTRGALAVLRASIIQLCIDDHENDAATLERWLRNETPQHFHQWLADPDNFMVVAQWSSTICGVGLINRRGELLLCYVAPGRQRAGIGRAMMRRMEERAISWGLDEIRLRSTANGCGFYEGLGYHRTGEAMRAFGVLMDHPYAKPLPRTRGGAGEVTR